MRKYQRGMSTIGWAAVLAVGTVIVTCAVKMVPAYTENIYIVDAMKFLVDNESNLESLSKEQIQSKLDKYMVINSVSPQAKEGIEIKRHERRLLVNSDYEVRVPIAFNIDVVMSFRNQLDTANPDACCDFLIESFDDKK